MFDALKKFGDVAGGIIFKETETGSVAKPAAVSKPMVGNFASQPQVNTTFNQEMVDELKKVVKKRVSAFTTLEERAAAMAGAIPDEAMRTKAAFGLLAAEGRSAQEIIKAIEIHVMDIDSEETRFTGACTASKQGKSGLIREEINTLEKQLLQDGDVITQLHTKIKETEERIAANSLKVTESKDRALVIEAEIDAKSLSFTMAAAVVKESLNNRKTALSSMLA